MPETERGSLFAHYDFDLSDTTTLYAQFLAGNNEVNSVGTLPLGIAGWAGTIYSGNPYLPANIQQLMTRTTSSRSCSSATTRRPISRTTASSRTTTRGR